MARYRGRGRGYALLILLLVSLPAEAQMLRVGDRDIFINGINIPWRHFGQDFGGSGNRAYEPAFYDRLFEELQSHGVNTIRMWLHCDGRASPLMMSDGSVRGLPPTFIADFRDFLDRAEAHELLVIPVLWTFEMVDRRRADLITDPAKTQSYIDKALRPLLEATAEYCNILAWEVINEPEWAMDIPFAGTTSNVLPAGDMQRFVAMCAQAVHETTDHMVTVGSAGLRFINDIYFKADNYWHDTDLHAQSPECGLAFLDFYSVHYYKWTLEILSPFKQKCASLQLDKPVLVSEFGQHKRFSTQELAQKAMDNGYAGIMPWSVRARDDEGHWSDYREDLWSFSQKHSSVMPQFPLCLSTDRQHTFQSCLLYPNPAQDQVIVASPTAVDQRVRVQIRDALGRLMMDQMTILSSELALDVSDLATGTYVLRVFTTTSWGGWHQMSRQKLMILR